MEPEGTSGARIRKRKNMPESYRNNYDKAISGSSRAEAVKAKCLDCCCWQRVEITNCTVSDCPLWPYRPYVDRPKDPTRAKMARKRLKERGGKIQTA